MVVLAVVADPSKSGHFGAEFHDFAGKFMPGVSESAAQSYPRGRAGRCHRGRTRARAAELHRSLSSGCQYHGM
jgi:hypothetical protein